MTDDGGVASQRVLIAKLRARVAKLEAALLFVRKGIDRKAIKNIGVAEPLKPGANAFDLIPLSAFLDAALSETVEG